VAAGDVARVPLFVTLNAPGAHRVSLKLAKDSLPGDNERWLVIDAQDHMDVVLMDGEPSADPLAGEADFLALALTTDIGQGEGFRVSMATETDWQTVFAADPDLLVLANVTSLAPHQADRLSRMVAGGTGLMIFVGDLVDPDNYNQLLFADGTGPLPVRLELLADDEASGLILEDIADSPLAALAQLKETVLERIPARHYYETQPSDWTREGVRVLARWNTTAAPPAAIDLQHANGRTLLWTVTADKAWGNWPLQPSYVLAIREAAKSIARARGGHRVITAGEPIRRLVSSDRVIQDPTVEIPAVDQPQPATVQSKDDPTSNSTAETSSFITTKLTHRPGWYRLTWIEGDSGTQEDWYAVNPDPRESDLTRIAAMDLTRKWSPLEVEIVSATDDDDFSIDMRGREWWRQVAWGLVGLMLTESCFAAWIGRGR
jgi:hypothetical protein